MCAKNGSMMLSMLACMVLSLGSVGDVYAQTVSILPATVNSPSVGREFTIQLQIASGNQVAGYEATVKYDSSALRYVRSANGSYLPAGAFVVPPIEEVGRGSVKVGATALGGSSSGGGTLASVTFAIVSVKSSQLTLTDVLVVDATGRTISPRVVNGEVVPAPQNPLQNPADVNGDNVVNIADLALVAARLGVRGQNSADVNGDNVVNIADLVLVAQNFGTTSGSTTSPPVTPTTELPSAPAGMVLIPAGTFQMGSDDADADNDEQPVHTVYVDAFYMDTHEVTNLEYKRFVLANPQWQKTRLPDALHDGNYLNHWSGNNYPSGKANHPVTYVSWYAAMAYSVWVGKRLPTEAEWEKAARGGWVGLKYPWGNTISPAKANYHRTVNDTTAVGDYVANGYGLFDMAGNVYEWCLDAYDSDFYFSSPSRNPLSDVNTISNLDLIVNKFTHVKSYRVLRGGSWNFNSRSLRVADRNGGTPTYTFDSFGFRCARAVTP